MPLARRLAAVARTDFMAQLGEIAVKEPAQQIAVLAGAQPIGVAIERIDHRAPAGNGGADLRERQVERLGHRLPAFRVGAVGLDIDERFPACFVIVADRDRMAGRIALHRQHGVHDQVNGKAGLAQAVGDAVDQEGHVGVDDGETLAAAAGHTQILAAAVDLDDRLAIGPLRSRFGDEGRRGVERVAGERVGVGAVQAAGKRRADGGREKRWQKRRCGPWCS